MQRFFSVAVSAAAIAMSITHAQQQLEEESQSWARVFDNNTVTPSLDETQNCTDQPAKQPILIETLIEPLEEISDSDQRRANKNSYNTTTITEAIKNAAYERAKKIAKKSAEKAAKKAAEKAAEKADKVADKSTDKPAAAGDAKGKSGTTHFDVNKFEDGSAKELVRLAALKHRIEEIDEKIQAYEPTDADTFDRLSDGKYVRRIYSGVTLTEDEQRGVDEFRAWLAETGKPIPLGMTDDHNFDLRFLNHSGYNHELAYTELWQNDQWMREHLVPLFEDPGKYLKLANTGAIYSYKRDKNYKPIIVFNIRKMIDVQMQYDEVEILNDFVMSYVDYIGMVPGRIEQHQMIFDCGGLSIWEVPGLFKALMGFHANSILHYRHTCFTNNVINLHWAVARVVNMVMEYFDPFLKEKVKFRSGDYIKEFREIFGEENLEQKYGGKLPNLQEGQFWPPQLNV